ncbi:MAG TPA: flap endonuclease [Sphaerochaeta sp.]|nr:flap endonuclease [Sphaerochaeta sp.]
MSDHMLLVDGMNLHFQMFFGMPARILNSQGKAIQGVVGFVGAIRKIIEMTKPTHVLVVFDGEHHNPRTDIDSEYKANRPDLSDEPDEENPFLQLPDVYAALDAIKIAHCETSVCEADDLIASYAKRFEAASRITISSFDSDFFQLIGPNTSILRYRGERSIVCNQDYLREKFNIEGSQYVDFKSLTGDTADNIRGVDGVGPKTASKLISQFGDLNNLMENYQSIESQRLRERIEGTLERLKLNRTLIQMDCNQELPYQMENLKFTAKIPKTRVVLSEIGLL